MQRNPRISILHPSYKRPALARVCFDTWYSNTKNKENIEYILCLSDNDPTLAQYMEIFRDTPVFRLVIEGNGWVKQLNAAARQSKGNLLICIGDDFTCPRDYDQYLIDSLRGKEDFIVKTDDGTQPWIMTLPMMDRSYYNRFNYIIYPEYLHMFGDTELSHVADLVGRKITLPILFSHEHYTTGKNIKDSVNIQNDMTWNQGETLYLSRMKNNFGIETPRVIELPSHHTEWLKTKIVV